MTVGSNDGGRSGNLEMVDVELRELEQHLLSVYIEEERTPVPQALFVSALSQLWILGLYELLRTWRQRVTELIAFSDSLSGLDDQEKNERLEELRRKHEKESGYKDGVPGFLIKPFEFVARDDGYRRRLTSAKDSSEMLFRRLEALRMTLAKHEIPRMKSTRAFAPGYGRIDMTNGSIYWQVSLGSEEVDLVSRRSLSDSIPTLLDDISDEVLNERVRSKVRMLPSSSYATKLVIATLFDGRQFPGTLIAWNMLPIAVRGHETMPFKGSEVVDVQPYEAESDHEHV